MATDLNLSTVELTSTLRTAPLNGAPSSSDYNSSARETLVDLAALAGFINNEILPLINALPATALQPDISPVGIEGRTIWTDTSDLSSLFFDSLDDEPLTIADTIRLLNGIITTLRQKLTDLGVEVASLQARLASTDQNDIALALQNLASSLNQLTINQLTTSTTVSGIVGKLPIPLRSGATLIPAGNTVNIILTYVTPFVDNFYTVTTGVEVLDAPDALVYVGGFQRNGVGAGITAAIVNYDSVDHSVILHTMSQANPGS